MSLKSGLNTWSVLNISPKMHFAKVFEFWAVTVVFSHIFKLSEKKKKDFAQY